MDVYAVQMVALIVDAEIEQWIYPDAVALRLSRIWIDPFISGNYSRYEAKLNMPRL